jgi:ABC-2 type transport system permease protein
MAASFLFACDIGALALAIGATTGRRGLSRGISAAVAVASYLVSTLAGMARGLRPLRPFSVYYHSLGTEPLYNGFSIGHTLVLVLVAVALVLWAALSFERRDLAVTS